MKQWKEWHGSRKRMFDFFKVSFSISNSQCSSSLAERMEKRSGYSRPSHRVSSVMSQHPMWEFLSIGYIIQMATSEISFIPFSYTCLKSSRTKVWSQIASKALCVMSWKWITSRTYIDCFLPGYRKRSQNMSVAQSLWGYWWDKRAVAHLFVDRDIK